VRPQAVAEALSLFHDEGFASAAVIGQMPAEAAAAQAAEVPD
jgi:hypothetical protein